MALRRHWGANDSISARGSARPGMGEVLVIAVATLLLVPVVGTAAGETPSPVAVIEQTVTVTDPLDAWLGGGPGTDGDLQLARETSLPGVTVVAGGPGELVYRVSATDADSGRAALAGSLSAYETARLELWSNLNRRLDFIPGLVEYVELRIAEELALLEDLSAHSPEGTMTSPARVQSLETEIRNWVAIRDELTGLRRTVMEPIWAEAPVRRRLEEIDRVLDDRFWAAMSVGRA